MSLAQLQFDGTQFRLLAARERYPAKYDDGVFCMERLDKSVWTQDKPRQYTILPTL